ncbi:MAG: DegV family protein [Veillonellaceae bacterium]|nr:DegV family protein [Veillonellaceae bacterium]
MIHIITDSTAALPEEYLARHENIQVVPLYVMLDGEYRDEREVSPQEVVDFVLVADGQPKTSQPSVAAWQEAIDAVPETDEILIITLTSAVSGTYQSACMVAKQNPDRKITVVDSETTNGGQAQLVYEAVAERDAGKTLEEIVSRLRRSIKNGRTMLMPSSLEFLRRGGRIGRAATLLGSILQVRPILYLREDNELDILTKVRTTKKALAEMKKDALSRPVRELNVAGILTDGLSAQFRDELQEALPDVKVTLTEGTAATATHLGPGLVAIMVRWHEEEEDV